MKEWLAQYNKLWAAIAGLALLYFLNQADIELPGVTEAITELVVSAITAWSVFRVTNGSATDANSDDFRGV